LAGLLGLIEPSLKIRVSTPEPGYSVGHPTGRLLGLILDLGSYRLGLTLHSLDLP